MARRVSSKKIAAKTVQKKGSSTSLKNSSSNSRKKTQSKAGKKSIDKELVKELNAALLSEIKKKESRNRTKRKKNREVRQIIKVLEELAGIDLSSTKRNRPKKKRISKSLNRRNTISKNLKKYIDSNRIDLVTYGIKDITTNELVYKQFGESRSNLGRYNLVLRNIVSSTNDLSIVLIKDSFDTVFKDYSGLVKSETRDFEQSILFFQYKDKFERPIYDNVVIKLSVSIPLVEKPDVIYHGQDDLKLFNSDGSQNEGNLFTSRELIEWFPNSTTYALCREWDKINGSQVGIAAFMLTERKGDGFVHYDLNLDKNFENISSKKQAPVSQSISSADRKLLIEEKVESLKAALEFLEPGPDRDAVESDLENQIIELTIASKTEKPISAIDAEDKKRQHELELERIRVSEKEKELQYKLELEKIKSAERMQVERMKMMKDMLDRGFSYAEIKDLIGE